MLWLEREGLFLYCMCQTDCDPPFHPVMQLDMGLLVQYHKQSPVKLLSLSLAGTMERRHGLIIRGKNCFTFAPPPPQRTSWCLISACSSKQSYTASTPKKIFSTVFGTANNTCRHCPQISGTIVHYQSWDSLAQSPSLLPPSSLFLLFSLSLSALLFLFFSLSFQSPVFPVLLSSLPLATFLDFPFFDNHLQPKQQNQLTPKIIFLRNKNLCELQYQDQMLKWLSGHS